MTSTIKKYTILEFCYKVASVLFAALAIFCVFALGCESVSITFSKELLLKIIALLVLAISLIACLFFNRLSAVYAKKVKKEINMLASKAVSRAKAPYIVKAKKEIAELQGNALRHENASKNIYFAKNTCCRKFKF